MKNAILFAGQGAQFVGMGKDLFDNYALAKKYFKTTDDVLGLNLAKICFEGSEEELKKTENTQPAILTMSYICYKLLEENGITADIMAGFSLGEYSALTAAGYFDFETGIKLVKARGMIMDKAVIGIDGAMAAILGLEDKIVEDICAKTKGVVVPVNYNCPGQLVISGEKKAVEAACKTAEEAGALKTVLLNVSGPFHSPLMESGASELAQYLAKIVINDKADKKVISNVTARCYDKKSIKDLLVKQMHSPVPEKTVQDFDRRVGFIQSKNVEKASDRRHLQDGPRGRQRQNQVKKAEV
ncbi:MAG: ACP S-malonyltransferase [Spirochaetes bacterium]|nr:ACP S-malonyltransferase [Spirochaetota bacterium]